MLIVRDGCPLKRGKISPEKDGDKDKKITKVEIPEDEKQKPEVLEFDSSLSSVEKKEQLIKDIAELNRPDCSETKTKQLNDKISALVLDIFKTATMEQWDSFRKKAGAEVADKLYNVVHSSNSKLAQNIFLGSKSVMFNFILNVTSSSALGSKEVLRDGFAATASDCTIALGLSFLGEASGPISWIYLGGNFVNKITYDEQRVKKQTDQGVALLRESENLSRRGEFSSVFGTSMAGINQLKSASRQNIFNRFFSGSDRLTEFFKFKKKDNAPNVNANPSNNNGFFQPEKQTTVNQETLPNLGSDSRQPNQ